MGEKEEEKEEHLNRERRSWFYTKLFYALTSYQRNRPVSIRATHLPHPDKSLAILPGRLRPFFASIYQHSLPAPLLALVRLAFRIVRPLKCLELALYSTNIPPSDWNENIQRETRLHFIIVHISLFCFLLCWSNYY